MEPINAGSLAAHLHNGPRLWFSRDLGMLPHGQGMTRIACALLLASAACIHADAARGEDKDERPAKALQDNSFLIEEAYNQEPGVVQHITTLQRGGRDWFFAFTQEWPLGSETHQFSYNIPYAWLRGSGRRASGIGDINLNYRWQALSETADTPAMAPRFTLILPTGDAARDLGMDSSGFEFLLPVSKIVSDRVTLHANAGFTYYFDVNGRQPKSWLAGSSAVYAVTPEFNLMLEAIAEVNESVTASGTIERERSFTISPGARYAFNLSAGQLVLGLGAPVRFAGGKPDFGAIFYISFEHSFVRRSASPNQSLKSSR